MTRRAVILARGLGTRLRRADGGAALDAAQARAADAGLKPLFPVNGRPLLDYALSELADAGLTDVALVVAPDHEAVRRHYEQDSPPVRVRVAYVVQQAPIGTADAVLAVEAWSGGEPFLVMNGDNIYPAHALRPLAALGEPGLPAFDAADLVRTSNIPGERIDSFAILDIDDDGYLRGIVEKPGASAPPASHLPPRASRLVSMNCWRFDARIFDACRGVPRSARGEFELPEAVALACRRGVRFRAFPARGPVLDLSSRGDAGDLARRLAGVVPRP